MEEPETTGQRLRYYGPGDIATFWQMDDAVRLIQGFHPNDPPGDAAKAIELHNAQQFVDAGFLPSALSEAEKANLQNAVAGVRSSVARFFTNVSDINVDDIVRDIPFEYGRDLLDLLGNNRAYERVPAGRMLATLAANGVHLQDMLSNKRLVRAYDVQLRELILAELKNAELLIRHHFANDRRSHIVIPTSLTPDDVHDLYARYVQAEEANYNYLGLLATAPINSSTGVDARLKLQATRRRARETKELFKNNPGIKSGAELRIAEDQDEPVIARLDGMVAHYSYSHDWLESTTDNPSVLNNFQHLFEFTDRDGLLTMPAYRAELGVFERFMTTNGRTDYHIGSAFNVREMTSTLQTQLVLRFLSSKDIELESVIAWFCHEYLPEEFGARGFSFSPSAKDSSFLEKTRHLLVEMESVIHQYRLYVQDGEIDRELLAIASEAVRYRQVTSLVDGKYLYATDAAEIRGILNALFSDQSSMNYIREDLHDDSMATLIIRNTIAYTDCKEHQLSTLDQLIELGSVAETGGRIQFASAAHFRVLHTLWVREAASYHHLSTSARSIADQMVDRGWMRRESTLLTSAEGSYFNYYLNKVEFTNGPELRNKYLHGSQANIDGPFAHFGEYVISLKLMIALVIKLNDDFGLAAATR